ncbi:MAG TPA: hypothetical protein VMU05_04270 [Dongiaceae bacterium]|nr:hypothetical protein [Dongiaceae bacterium]
MPPFHLSKWYLDFVTDSGDVSIAYVGDLRWGPVHLHFSSLLRSTGTEVTQQNSLRKPNLPACSGDKIEWISKQFDFSAIWHAASSELRETVFANSDGCVEWHCLMPQAHARKNSHPALGYVEHLTMTIPPWKIPIHQLRWGRFCSASDYAVWIDWQGEYSKRILYRNGNSTTVSEIDDEQIVFADGSRLTADRSLTLRSGPLGTTALSSIPGLSKTFPARLLQVNECKWRSRARLESPGHDPVEGWAIHEVVTWPQ